MEYPRGSKNLSMQRESVPSEIAIVGLGLIGGSLGLALGRAGARVSGVDRDRRVVSLARRRGMVSRGTTDLGAGLRGAGMVVLCVPVPAILREAPRIARAADVAAVVTDTGSVKRPVIEAMTRALERPERFVGGHPMTGSERSGIEAADGALFRGRLTVLTPVAATAAAARARVARMWRRCGARVIALSPRRHDRIVARTSHLPHAIAVSLLRSAFRSDPAAPLFAAGSFLDATRVAESPGRLWEGIFLANRTEVAAATREFALELGGFMAALRRGGVRRRMAAAAAARRLASRRTRGRGEGA